MDIITIEEKDIPEDTIRCDLMVSIATELDTMDITTLIAESTGGVAPLIYAWSDNTNTAVLMAPVTGNYSVTVTDVNNCMATASIDYEAPSFCSDFEIVSILIESDSVSIPTTYALSPQLVGGTAPFIYLWSDSSTVETLMTTATGTYSVTVTDSLGCVDEEQINF